MARNLSFRCDTLFTNTGGRVGRIKPNELGVYAGLPMMVLGERTQQNTYYDPQSIVDQITNPNTRFNMVFRANKLYGEYGHPTFYDYKTQEDKLQRLTTVEEKQSSHLFTGIYTDAPSSDGTIIVRADIKPSGPYGSVFKESLDDPVTNTAFSLRAFVDTKVQPDGLKYRTVRSLTTWDTVGASGYKGTDKANAIGLESFAGDDYLEYEINILEDGKLCIDQIALESYSNTDLNEIFGVPSLSRIMQSRTIIKPDQSLMTQYPTLYPKALFNDFFKEI